MRMNEIMSEPVRCIEPSATADAAWNEMRLHSTHHLVVQQGREIVGVISSRDLSDRRNRLVAELMSRDVVTADPTTTVHKAANLLRGRYVGCLPIVDGGKLVGIVTTSDLLELLGRGAITPTPHGDRWTLKSRGPRKRPPVANKRNVR